MDWERWDPAERLAAEQAVLAHREVMKAVRGAPHGRGLEVTEGVVLAQGRRQMALMMEGALRAAAGAEKKGSAVPADAARRTGPTRGSSW